MSIYLSQNWNVRKPLARSRHGVVATQCRLAGEAGAGILAAGGNAVDAAVATGLALATVEPWNSGLGGVGFMLVYMARARRVEVVDFGPISPRGLDPKQYPLTGGVTQELFVWPQVAEDRNVHGPMSIAVPGHVDGMATALARFGTRRWQEVIAPAVALAERGMPVDWFLTLKVALTASELARYDSTRAVWLPGGMPPATPPGTPLRYLQLTGLATTLKRLAQHGPRDFYEGGVARDIAEDVKAAGGFLSAADLAGYRARVVAPLEAAYRDAQLALAPGLSAGPSMKRAFEALSQHSFRTGGPHADAFVAYARVLREAYAERLQSMGDMSDAADARAPGCTTHFNVVDSDGNMVAVTQTLLSVFGSRYVLPSTGILMNNGIFWFDPRPGQPNSIAPGKRPLTNMSPLLATRDGNAWFALGGSGGRKIFPAVFQIASMLIDHGLSLEDAFHRPRIDASGGEFVGVDPRHPAEVKQALAQQFPLQEVELTVQPNSYACPSAVLIDAGGERLGIADVMSPWSAAVAQDEAA